MGFLKNTTLVLASLIVAFMLCEMLTRVLLGHPLEITNTSRRLMVYESGDNFQNIGDIIKYYPNRRFRSATYFVLDKKDVVEEYSYELQTNNLGLLQKRDVDNGQNSYLILGDSFTEGQGAIPWFYKLESATPTHGYQLVNGGILGTGPLQWELLKNHLVAEYDLELERVLLIMIGADIVRRVWNFHPDGMRCLKTAQCEKSLGDFYGYEFGEKPDGQIKQEILTMHKSADRTVVVDQGLEYAIKRLIKKSAFIYRLYISIKELGTTRLELNNVHSKYDANLAAMERMLIAGKKPGKIMIIPTIIEIDDSDTIKWDKHSRYFFNWAEKKNVAFEICRLTREDYHKHDAHPNKKGYEKILKCVSAILED